MEEVLHLYFVRHGETSWNETCRVQGQTDISLNAKGVQQAKEASARFEAVNFTASYSSDLERAHHTAQIILEELAELGNESVQSVRKRTEIRERYFGEFEGKTYGGIR